MSALSQHLDTINILILEDDPSNRLVLEYEFPRPKYAVSLVNDTADARNVLSQPDRTFQLGIFDLKVPLSPGSFPDPKNGLLAIEAARKAFPDMIIVTISSIFITEEIRVKMQQLRVSKDFPKPFLIEPFHSYIDASLACPPAQ